MTFADIYLTCFVVGFALSVIAVFSGALHLDILGLDHHHGHVGGDHGHGSVFNLGTVATFLTWFGGVGYLLSRAGILLWVVFLVAIAGGIVGGSILLCASRKLLGRERPLNAADYEMVGVLGKLTSGIREGGIGEMSFSQEGMRRSAPARSDDGGAIEKGTEVFVTRYEKGVAYVRRFEGVDADL